MLEARNLNYRYGIVSGKAKETFEIRNVSVKVEPGYVSCLLGRNGSGKTTLLSLLYGMLQPKSGEILWMGERLTPRKMALFRQEVAYAGKKWCVDGMTVEKNVDLLSKLYPTFDRGYFDELLSVAGAEECREKMFAVLSTGEQVKAELCFLLARRPKLILLDEPLANIDPVFQVDVLELLRKAVAENETGVLISTHLIDEISDMVDFVHVMEAGSLRKSGNRFDVLGEGELRDVLLSREHGTQN